MVLGFLILQIKIGAIPRAIYSLWFQDVEHTEFYLILMQN
jgi:hypothetical protein